MYYLSVSKGKKENNKTKAQINNNNEVDSHYKENKLLARNLTRNLSRRAKKL